MATKPHGYQASWLSGRMLASNPEKQTSKRSLASKRSRDQILLTAIKLLPSERKITESGANRTEQRITEEKQGLIEQKQGITEQ